jgi:hypothetical protein
VSFTLKSKLRCGQQLEYADLVVINVAVNKSLRVSHRITVLDTSFISSICDSHPHPRRTRHMKINIQTRKRSVIDRGLEPSTRFRLAHCHAEQDRLRLDDIRRRCTSQAAYRQFDCRHTSTANEHMQKNNRTQTDANRDARLIIGLFLFDGHHARSIGPFNRQRQAM